MSEIGNQQDSVRAIVWRDGALELLDQRLLPQRCEYLRLHGVAEVAAAIRGMVVRGAPAIGITAAYGVVLAGRNRYAESGAGWKESVTDDLSQLGEARPTAVNLRWALERMGRLIEHLDDGDPTPALLAEARRVHEEDIEANRRMGALGAALIEETGDVLTHCNAGALATGGYGTALGVIRSAWSEGRIRQVYADETRPWLQGSRLTAWELTRDGIPVTLLADGAAASLMRLGNLRWVIVGADRVAANGDVANKIGTYSAAIAARHHGVRFMVVAPTSTIDMDTPDGERIPIERRGAEELLACAGVPVATGGAGAWNPVFDVTPAELVDALVTEKSVVLSPNAEKLAELMAK